MDYKLLGKNIVEYLLRVFCFILVVKCLFHNIGSIFVLLLFPIIFTLLIIMGIFIDTDNISEIQSWNIYTNVFVYVSSFFTLYFLAKIFGIFKKLDKLNIFVTLTIISIISYLLILVGRINFLVDEITYRDGLEYAYTMYLLIPAFLLYKFFGFLTQKFPFPFKKIGYYTSIEFVKDLCSKIKKNYIKRP